MAVGPKAPRKPTFSESLDTLVRPSRPDWEMEHYPDDDPIRAYNEMLMYLEDRGKLYNPSRKGDRRGRQETYEEMAKRPPKKHPIDQLENLLKDNMKGRWPVFPADPQLEKKLFNQNQDYKKPLPYDY